jgi:hypothetical protein
LQQQQQQPQTGTATAHSLTKPKRAQMRKPFKERQQFWCLFFFGFPSTHYQSRQSWLKMKEQLGCFICIPVCRDHIPRRYPDGHDEFFQNSETRGGLAAHKR